MIKNVTIHSHIKKHLNKTEVCYMPNKDLSVINLLGKPLSGCTINVKFLKKMLYL